MLFFLCLINSGNTVFSGFSVDSPACYKIVGVFLRHVHAAVFHYLCTLYVSVSWAVVYYDVKIGFLL